MTLICMKMKLHAELTFIWRVSHLDSFWKKGTRETLKWPMFLVIVKVQQAKSSNNGHFQFDIIILGWIGHRIFPVTNGTKFSGVSEIRNIPTMYIEIFGNALPLISVPFDFSSWISEVIRPKSFRSNDSLFENSTISRFSENFPRKFLYHLSPIRHSRIFCWYITQRKPTTWLYLNQLSNIQVLHHCTYCV